MGLLLRRGIATVAVSCFLIVLSVYGYLGYIPTSAASGTLAATGGSWNPSVNCTPIVVTIEQVLGSQTNSMGGATGNGSMFYPGTTSPVGSAKRWLTPGPTPPGWVSPGPWWRLVSDGYEPLRYNFQCIHTWLCYLHLHEHDGLHAYHSHGV